MYSNIGEKIKRYARTMFVIGVIFAIIFGMILIDYQVGLALAIMVGGSLLAWVGSWFTYGFGEIIVKLCEIEKHTATISQNSKNADSTNKTATTSLQSSSQNTPKATTSYSNDGISFYQIINSSNLPADIKEKIKELKSLKDQKIISEQECRNRVNSELNGFPLATTLQILNKL